MKPYKNLHGDSGIVAFETGEDYIKLQFRGGDIYWYNDKVTGKQNIKLMKQLALKGRGLSTFVSKQVKDKYYKIIRL